MFIPECIADLLIEKPFLSAAYRRNMTDVIKPRPADLAATCSLCLEFGHRRYSCRVEYEILEKVETEDQYNTSI